MKTYPSEKECIGYLKDAGCSKRVIVHCCTVRAVAEQFMTRIDCDKDLVIAGALLHDIGRSRDHSVFHASVGAEILEELGVADEIVEIVRKHTGAGLDKQEAISMGLPDADYMPKTLEEKIVAHADNMVRDNTVVMHTRSVDKLKAKGATRGANRMEKLHLELSKLYGEDLDVVVGIIGEHPHLKGPCSKYLS